MSKRKYTHMKEMEVQILSMRESGMTRQEIADELGLEKAQTKAWVTRYNRGAEGKVCSNLSSPERVSSICYVQVL